MSNPPLVNLPPPLFDELGALIRGQVYQRDDPVFQEYSAIFNGNVLNVAKAVACPVDAEDVSKILTFCHKHQLYPSVKAGGFGTAGWAVGGDLIIDLHNIVDIDIETPQDDGTFVSLKDVAADNSKGKQPASSLSNLGKRRREEDNRLRNYDAASASVAGFLQGNPPNVDGSVADRSPPSARRRLTVDTPPDAALPPPEPMSRETSGDSATSSGTMSSNSSNPSTIATSPTLSTAGLGTKRQIDFQYGGDPFGYIDAPAEVPIHSTARQAAFTQPVAGPWASSSSTLFTNPDLPPTSLTLLPSLQPVHSHAYVTFGAGKRQKEIDIYTANHPLPATSLTHEQGGTIPYHVPFAAHPVGSSIMLLGGFGFLGRLHGLSIDNLVEVELVLADGRIIIVNEKDYPDLWWAIRGGGPAFGVATRYKAKAYPVPVVFAGNLLYRFHKATAPSLIKHFRDCIKGAPRELYANILLTAGPQGKDSLVVIQMCYVGSKEKGQEYLAAISAWDGERCLLNEVDEKSFLHQQDSVAQVLRGKAGRQWFIRSALISSLPDDIINQTVLQFSNTPLGCTWLFELSGGAIADFEDTCVPKSQREASFTIAALHQWDMGLNDPRCINTAEDWIKNTLRPVQVGGPFPSFLGRHEPAERTMKCFGDNWDRMKEIKNKYDPKNMFRNTFWPLDESGEAVDPRTHEPPTPVAANKINPTDSL
ncbi:hypothetical protein HGRIS_001855 [Hohenbuehelia grisea]|uniref:FAD-binding PCMH-type domain-containing protein n=1 Tax=Hohenbuehelia grisea TaxID=104357 RepID=A0ABR3JJT4_9AGAR